MRISPRPRRKFVLGPYEVPVIALEGTHVELTVMIDATLATPAHPRTIGARPWFWRAPAILALPPGRIVGVVGGTLIFAALLNADHLLDDARKKPFGSERDFWVGVWEPVHKVSDRLYLNRPRSWLDDLTGRELVRTQAVGAPIVVPTSSATPSATAAAIATGTPTPAAFRLRTPTSERPWKLWVGGDSMAIEFGGALARLSGESGVITPDLDARGATGLTRPDFFDWPLELKKIADRDQPEVMVIIFGANDSQGLKTADGNIHQPGSEGWRAEYRLRVAATMDLVASPGRVVVWVGQPIMESSDLSDRMRELNTIFQAEAATRPGVLFFDSWPLFVDANGRYSAFLPGDSGGLQNLRDADGVHLSLSGADRLASAVLKRLMAEAKAPEPPLPTFGTP